MRIAGPEDDSSESDAEEGPGFNRKSLEQVSSDTYLEPSFWSEVEALLIDKRQIIFYGPPGTGKTFVSQKFADYFVSNGEDGGGATRVLQFHASYSYEDFMEGIRPQSVVTETGRRELDYRVCQGVFRTFAEEARKHPSRRYVLILDEINRGDLPRIFGELLYLLEYRDKEVILPYSGTAFGIPDNLFLIGTMNTADRSIALLDHAVRRRFHFVALKSRPSIVTSYFEGLDPEHKMRWVASLMEILNKRLSDDGIDWTLHIGHSYFLRPSLDDQALQLIGGGLGDHGNLPL